MGSGKVRFAKSLIALPEPRIGFFMLNTHQEGTIKDLEKSNGIKTPQEIIEWCKTKMKQPRRTKAGMGPNTRRRSVKYYKEIIAHYDK